jgi:putative MATE family efflux protein
LLLFVKRDGLNGSFVSGLIMKDLTQGSIVRQILMMAAPIAAGMIFQTLYFLIDLYFVAQLGDAAIAGVSAAGNVAFVVLALTQVLGVGTVALIAHAVGRKDQADANLVFNQSIALSVAAGVLMLLALFGLTHVYMQSVAADGATVHAGETYLYWYAPGLALQFALVAMGSALRGTGIVKPTMVVQMITVVINAILAPILIAGWGTGYPLGVMGAGLASSIALAIGVLMLWQYFRKLEHYVGFNSEQWAPQWTQCKRILNIGLPAGGEFAVMFMFFSVIYIAIRDFGAEAQAGFGIGSRVMQAIFLPAMAIAFAAGPIAGQNYGAKDWGRVRETFLKCIILSTILMAAITLFTQWRSREMVGAFTDEAPVIEVGATFLQLISINFIAQGFIFTCSSMFQGLGNTRPALWSSATRLVTFAVPTLWLSTLPGFRIEHVWYLAIATATLQAIVSLWLLRIEFSRKLTTNNT